MTGLTPDDISRLIAGLELTRYGYSAIGRVADAKQEVRIAAALRGESNTQMLLDVARADIDRLRLVTEAADNLRAAVLRLLSEHG